VAVNERIKSLDSIRGLAALTVVVHHCLLVFPAFYALQSGEGGRPGIVHKVLAHSPLHLGWAGTEAVILFFVLSGFVLALPFLDGRSVVTSRFIAKRACRIYLPYVAAVGISTAVLFLFTFESTPGTSQWFRDMWSFRPDGLALVDTIAMGGRQTHNVDTAAWSLVHEMRASLLFPLIAYAVGKLDWRLTLLGAFALSVTGYVVSTPGGFESFWGTAFYLGFFVLGAVLARHRAQVTEWARRVTRRPRVAPAVLAGVGFLYLWRWLVPIPAARNGFVVAWVVAVASAVLFAFVLASTRAAAALAHRSLQWLGKVSYSLYLTHTIVLLALIHGFAGVLPLGLIAALTPLVALPVAAAFYRMVEAPSMRLAGHVGAAPAPSGRAVRSRRLVRRAEPEPIAP
jgi:peptidoglycan/LPS O-acetylase OafA/YrhL